MYINRGFVELFRAFLRNDHPTRLEMVKIMPLLVTQLDFHKRKCNEIAQR